MSLFNPQTRTDTDEHRRIYALYEVWYTAVDFAAAGCFLTGSAMMLLDIRPGANWLFLAGSVLFAAKPTIRLARELRYLRDGEIDFLAEKRKKRRSG